MKITKNAFVSTVWKAVLVFSLTGTVVFAANNRNANNNNQNCSKPANQTNGCVSFNFEFPILPLEEGLGLQRFSVVRETPSPTLFTPSSLNYASSVTTFVSSITEAAQLPAGISHKFKLRDENNNAVEYEVPVGSSVARATGDYTGRDDRVLLLDENDNPTTGEPVFYRLIKGDGSEIDYPVQVGEFAVRVKTAAGRVFEAGQAYDVVLEDGAYRQLRTATGLVDLVVLDEFSYEIRLYTPDNVGTKGVDGLYVPLNAPYRTMQVRNPTGDVNELDEVQLIETHGTYQLVAHWEYVPAAQDWRFTKGLEGAEDTEGMLTEQIIVLEDSATGDQIETRELSDENGELVSSNVERKRTFPWGDNLVIESIKDSTNFALTTTHSYYDDPNANGYGKRKETVYPNGDWVRYHYDSENRLIEQVEPWMDSAVGSSAAQAKSITYFYTPVDSRDQATDAFDSRARITITTVLGVETGRTYNAYFTDSTTGEYTEIEERTTVQGAAYGSATNLRTTQVYYADTVDAVSAGRLKSETTPDGVVMAYSYAQADVTSNFIETVDRLGSSGAVAYKSTRTVMTKDTRGNLIQKDSYVYDGSDWQLYSTTTQSFSDEISSKGFQLTERIKDGRTVLNQSWYGPLVGSRTDEAGAEYLYTYDLLDRMEMEIKLGANGAEDIITNYNRDLGAIGCGCDGQLAVERTAGGIALTSSQKTDSAGRRSERTDENGYTTTYSYVDDRRVTTETLPSGATRISENYFDGRIKSITGTAVIPEYYSYTVNANGSTTTRIETASEGSPRYREMTYDVAERMIKEESPAFDGSVFARNMAYSPLGLLTQQSETGRADTLFEYDTLANLIRSGLDVDGDGALVLASADRITETDRFMQLDGAGDWFGVNTTTVYPELNAASSVEISRTARRMSNFPLAGTNGDLVSETISTDIHGQNTVHIVSIDRAAKTMMQTTDVPDSTIDALRTTVNGLLVSENSSTVAAAMLYGYDAVERRVSVKDPRHAQSATIEYYTDSMQVFSQTDAAGNTTAFTYLPQGQAGAGQIASVTDALLQKSYRGYDLFGRQIRSWGETDYPQAYGYNVYGELETLTTWRDPAIDFSTSVWPNPTGGDVTTWSYQPSSGLLMRKEYADQNGTDYSYDAANRLRVRTWAREGGLDTTYSYDPATGELTNVNYEAADTADITYTYDRLGRQSTVTDATGTRNFTYDPSTLQLTKEQLDSTFYQNHSLTRSIDSFGRASSYTLQDSASSAISAVNYTYGQQGRLATVSDGTDTFTYGYETDSNLLASLTAPQHSVAYQYEDDRDVMISVENTVSGSSYSKYAYTYDELGRRADREQSGSAFSQTNTDTFAYNSRSEVEGASNDVFTDDAYNSSYSFDQIGNRIGNTVDLNGSTAYAATELNQYSAIGSASPVYDADGNLTGQGTWTYSWNNENRLSSATNGTTTIDFLYDYQGRLVQETKQTENQTTGNWETDEDSVFVYDGWNRIAKHEVDSSFVILNSQFLIWGLDLSGTPQGAGGVGGLLKEGSFYPVYDVNGNIMQKLDGTGVSAMNVAYDPFGNIISGTLVGAYGFSTKPLIDELDWYYYSFRYYDPVTGRWPSRDPIGTRGGSNEYAFVFNEPLQWYDYLGGAPKTLDDHGIEGSNEASECTANDKTQPNRVEYCGKICEDECGKITRTGPVRGTSTATRSSCDLSKAPCPKGTKQIGAYHSHTKRSNYGPPSPGDKSYAKKKKCPLYTGRGKGKVDRVNPDGTVSPVQRGGKRVP